MRHTSCAVIDAHAAAPVSTELHELPAVEEQVAALLKVSKSWVYEHD